jgi:hypothetical protein
MDQMRYLINKRMFGFLHFDLTFPAAKADVFHSGDLSQEGIDQLDMDEHFISSATDAHQGRVHQVTEFEIDFFDQCKPHKL